MPAPPSVAARTSRFRWAQLLAVPVAVVAAVLVSGHDFLDLQVYRDAGRAYLDGRPLFDTDFTSGLRFIYGPVAAVAFVPFTLMPAPLAYAVWTALGVGLLWWVLRTVSARLGLPTGTALGLLAPAVLLGPVRDTLGYGQVNLVLMALVVLDVTGVLPRRLRGVGIGVAAAVKTTPAAFGLLLLVRRDHASVVRAAGAFLLVGGLGVLLAPADSRQYWSAEFLDTGRGGAHHYAANQAVNGLLARLGVAGTLADAVWGVAVVVVVAAAAYAARRFTLSGEHVLALGVVALASLLAAPLAVSHHWVYVVLLLPLLLAPQYRSWRPALAGAAAVFLLSAHALLPYGEDRELDWGPVQQLLGGSEGLVGLALLVAAVVVARSRRPTPPRPVEAPEVAPG